jgi:hypothetical protein
MSANHTTAELEERITASPCDPTVCTSFGDGHQTIDYLPGKMRRYPARVLSGTRLRTRQR